MRGNDCLLEIKKNCSSGTQIQTETQVVSRLQSEGKVFMRKRKRIIT